MIKRKAVVQRHVLSRPRLKGLDRVLQRYRMAEARLFAGLLDPVRRLELREYVSFICPDDWQPTTASATDAIRIRVIRPITAICSLPA